MSRIQQQTAMRNDKRRDDAEQMTKAAQENAELRQRVADLEREMDALRAVVTGEKRHRNGDSVQGFEGGTQPHA